VATTPAEAGVFHVMGLTRYFRISSFKLLIEDPDIKIFTNNFNLNVIVVFFSNTIFCNAVFLILPIYITFQSVINTVSPLSSRKTIHARESMRIIHIGPW
jgi:hypothetical protein